MKNQVKKIGLLALATIAMASCTKNDEPTPTPMPPSPTSWFGIKEQGIKAHTQSFTATAGAGVITLTSVKGVTIKIDGNTLTKNGNPVTGAIDIKYIELFDKGNMLVTNKPTMGIMANGNHDLLKSGGEFYIQASQGGVDLATTGLIQLQIPTTLTGGLDTAMTLWTGEIDTKDNLAWRGKDAANGANGGVKGDQNAYNATFGNFGWTNVDRFYSDPRPKTTILAGAPTGYDNLNSAVYLSYDGEGQNALAKLDTYTAAGLFSEHYGQIPIGLACHVIFVTEDNGQWRYAIKGVTTTANAVYTFTLAETTVGTEAQLVAAINAIQ